MAVTLQQLKDSLGETQFSELADGFSSDLTEDQVGTLKLSEATKWARLNVEAKDFEFDPNIEAIECAVLDYAKYLMFAYSQSETAGEDEKESAENYLNLLLNYNIDEPTKSISIAIKNKEPQSRFTW